MNWTWLGGFGTFAVGAIGIWYSVTRTDYLPKLAVWLIKQALPIIMKRKSPEQEKLWREVVRHGELWDELNNKPKDWGH